MIHIMTVGKTILPDYLSIMYVRNITLTNFNADGIKIGLTLSYVHALLNIVIYWGSYQMKKLALMAAVCFALVMAIAPLTADAGSSYAPQKAVYHFNQKNLKTTHGGLRNIQNHINAVGEMNLKVAAVFHGGGVFTLFTDPSSAEDKELVEKIKSRVMSLKQQGVAFNICANTLKGKKIDYKKNLYDVHEADIVPSGVAEISKLQQEGYTYVKP